jgi:glutamine synthetase type III
MKDIPKIFGENVFNKEQMLKYLGDDTYQKYRRAVRNDEKEIIDLDLANKIADGMKR